MQGCQERDVSATGQYALERSRRDSGPLIDVCRSFRRLETGRFWVFPSSDGKIYLSRVKTRSAGLKMVFSGSFSMICRPQNEKRWGSVWWFAEKLYLCPDQPDIRPIGTECRTSEEILRKATQLMAVDQLQGCFFVLNPSTQSMRQLRYSIQEGGCSGWSGGLGAGPHQKHLKFWTELYCPRRQTDIVVNIV